MFATRGLASSAMSCARSISHVTIIGGGLMGSGITQVAAQTGHKVTLVDLDQNILDQSTARISKSLARVAKKKFGDDAEGAKSFVESTMGAISTATDACSVVKDTDLVIEAIVENMAVKHRLFKELDSVAPQDVIFTSNTSSLSISEIAEVTSRKDKFGGLHFFNPVPVMKLLEVVKTENISAETLSALTAFGKKLGKVTIECTDTPGFIVNRLLVPNIAEAVKMLERGVASAPDIDTAMKLGAGHPMGPLQLADYVGLDTCLFILEGWSQKYPDVEIFQVPEMLKRLVAEGKLGNKSGEGFYKH
ncbi:hypothetical protein ACHWQZ_G015494 [Mnemiopsis leidyi]